MPCAEAYKLSGCGGCTLPLKNSDDLKNFPLDSIAFILVGIFHHKDVKTKAIDIMNCSIKCNAEISISVGESSMFNDLIIASINDGVFKVFLADWYRSQGNRHNDLDMRLVVTYIESFEKPSITASNGTVINKRTIEFILAHVDGLLAATLVHNA